MLKFLQTCRAIDEVCRNDKVQLDHQTDVEINFAWHAGVRLNEDYSPARSRVDLNVRSGPKLAAPFFGRIGRGFGSAKTDLRSAPASLDPIQ